MIHIDKASVVSGRGGRAGAGRAGRAEKKTDAQPRVSKSGISDADAVRMREMYGSNALTKKKSRSLLSHFISNFNDPIIKILLGALALNVIFSFRHSNWPETIGVAIAVLIATSVSTISEYSSEAAAKRLSDTESETCFVRRSSKICEIHTDEIVAGDAVILLPGMRIPADGVVSRGKVACDQSALTGEGREISKVPGNIHDYTKKYLGTDTAMDASDESLALRGAVVLGGEGEMTVLRTGDRTLYGTVAAGLSEEAPESPLKRRLSVLAGEISFIGYVAAAMVAISYLFNVFFIDSGMNIAFAIARMQNIPYLMHELLCALTLAVSVLVVAVPEGLPMMITVVLSSNMKKMLSHGVLVKRMVGIETAGAMSILFTDKTGTLTEGKMTAKEILTAEGGYKSAGALKRTGALYAELFRAARCIPPEGSVNSADTASIAFFGGGPSDGEFSGGETVERIPFDSGRRFAAASVRIGNEIVTYVRGAPELILSASAYFLSHDGSIKPLSTESRELIEQKRHAAAGRGGRLIASAYAKGDHISDMAVGKFPELVFCGLYHLEDKLRKDAARAVSEAREAGIHVVMMTGDNRDTAEAIASECGILSQGEKVLTGSELADMDENELCDMLPRISVIARALPADKLRVIRAARSAGYISGMTGDGINDAPSLKAADVGFAMGSGTDVAKEAGDVVITDDSFSSIVRASLYGRTIFRSIRKFVVFQLTMNLCATAVSFIGPFVGIESPVTVIQMLWVNIIMDTLGALAFAGEPARPEYMKRPPFPSDEKILTGRMTAGVVLTGFYMVIMSMFFLLSGFCRRLFGGLGERYFLTAFFAFFIFCGIALSFNSRTHRINPFSGISKNKPFIVIMTLVAVVQLGLVYFGGDVFRCVPLAPSDMARAALLSLLVLPGGAAIKLLVNKKR